MGATAVLIVLEICSRTGVLPREWAVGLLVAAVLAVRRSVENGQSSWWAPGRRG